MAVEYREEPCKSALNRVRAMPFEWSLNPYMGCAHRCTFCYVRAFELRADRPSGDAYGRSIRVKVNVAEVLRAELGRRGWRRETVSVGAATDPYQPAEGRYRLTRACLEALRDACNPFHVITRSPMIVRDVDVLADRSNPFSIITRGPLIVRDVDVLTAAASRAAVTVTFSVPTLDDSVWRTTEPGTAPPLQRLRALSALASAGIRASVGMAPILPGLSDHPDQLRRVVEAARAAGACGVWANLLHLKPGTREHFLECLARDWPELLPRYERLYDGGRAYLPARELEPVRDQVRAFARSYRIRDRRTTPIEPPAGHEQLSLLSA